MPCPECDRLNQLIASSLEGYHAQRDIRRLWLAKPSEVTIFNPHRLADLGLGVQCEILLEYSVNCNG
jgi:hypothetical protein